MNELLVSFIIYNQYLPTLRLNIVKEKEKCGNLGDDEGRFKWSCACIGKKNYTCARNFEKT